MTFDHVICRAVNESTGPAVKICLILWISRGGSL